MFRHFFQDTSGFIKATFAKQEPRGFPFPKHTSNEEDGVWKPRGKDEPTPGKRKNNVSDGRSIKDYKVNKRDSTHYSCTCTDAEEDDKGGTDTTGVCRNKLDKVNKVN